MKSWYKRLREKYQKKPKKRTSGEHKDRVKSLVNAVSFELNSTLE